ncbi:iron-siderophore ABC transporter substrate-binding protein [Gordonia polyisoprenivorans]|uniref:iron-siderophore ABC transporter substrate-binding protein n=1 Tax=Gordonia polyisoprenivorans TaxID=84595 RepID=UPI002301E357|nr:iron-siderophore ABC transporter substrate-binding protein [Gordonia polyisoprenivorans]WCB38077.1 iron-siderophore ABC transporter substrate-binding protein [Gordonia polyisoprenivorans]
MVTFNKIRGGAVLMALVALVAALLTACGSDSDDSSSSAAPAAEQGALPATITHKFGSTEVTAVPKRVVSLGYTDQDALLALGVVPVTVRNWDGMTTTKGAAVGAWATDLLKGQKPEIYNAEEIDPEAIAAMKPDLIVAVYSGIDKDTYDALSKIAPVIAQKADYADYEQPWDVTTEEIGAAVGQPKKAAELVAGVKKKITDLGAAHPNWKGKTISVATYDGSALSAFSAADPRTQFFTSLGFAPNTQVDQAAGDKFYATLSLEEARKLDTDVIVWDQLSYAPKGKQTVLDQSALANLPAVKDNHSVYLEGELEKAFGWQTVLSLGYVVDNIGTPLAQAAG